MKKLLLALPALLLLGAAPTDLPPVPKPEPMPNTGYQCYFAQAAVRLGNMELIGCSQIYKGPGTGQVCFYANEAVTECALFANKAGSNEFEGAPYPCPGSEEPSPGQKL